MSRCQGMALLIAAAIGAVPMLASAQIQEIIVTTRKKEESLQDVPIAVSAITAEQIERQGVADLDDVVRNTPSVQFDRSYGPSDTRITIRGLSNTRGRSNVAFLVDGIDVTTENLIVAGSGLLANRRLLTDVQRIEIVKGPQSALYGRAAFAGAINYITKEPGDVVDGNAKIDFAQDGFQQVDGAFGGPLSDTLGMRVTGFWYNSDGHYVNAMSGDDVGGSGGSGGALTTVWRPNDITKVKLRAEYSQEDYDPLANLRIGGGWQGGEGARLAEYPDGMLQHARNMINDVRNVPGLTQKSGLGYTGSSTFTGLLDFNQYCPAELKDSTKGPGMCLPATFGSADGRVIKHSENPLTGKDFDGTDLRNFRSSLIIELDLDGGLMTFLTGWTNFDAHDTYDQDWQAEADYTFTPPGGSPGVYPVTPSPDFYNGRRADQLTAGQIANTDSTVDQFSQEIRFASKLDGPWQYTVGALFWDEQRGLDDSNGIFACMPVGKAGGPVDISGGQFTYPSFGYTPGICDGGNFGGDISKPTVIGWQEMARQLQPQPAGRWEADTRHWSFYANLTYEFAENWKIEFEDRFVSESFNLLKPNQSLCTNLGTTAIDSPFLLETGGLDLICTFEKVLTEGANLGSTDSIRSLEGEVTSHFSTPKVTLNWQVTPDNLMYFFWAKAQKPGGINQLTGGGSPVTLDFEAFDPEKLQAWELGSKNSFDVGGPLQANVSMFFQDYTDKQVSTQIIDAAGVSQPKVLNASGAEIWGAELELIWQPDFAEGLLLNLAYTYLDAEYTDFFDDATSAQRLAGLNAAGRGCELIYKNANNEVVPYSPSLFVGAGPGVFCRVDLGGAKLERTPEHAIALAASYQRPLLDTGLDLLVEANASWQDKRYVDADNFLYFDAYWLVSTRLGLVHPKYEIIAYVDNLLDDDTIRSGGSGPDFARQVAETGFTAGLGVSNYFGTLPDPRIFGIRATYRFGGE